MLALLVYLVMYTWHKGIMAVTNRLSENPVPIDTFIADITQAKVARVPGTAVFLTRSKTDTPPVILWYVEHSQALHEHVLAITLEIASTPWIAAANRLSLTEVAPNFWSVTATYGFMERPDMPALMTQITTHQCPIDPTKLTYFISMEKIVPRTDGHGLPRWIEAIFSMMMRNSTRVTDYLRVPASQVVDLGRQISI
jgi:KUP system potassium uptake protein